MLGTNDLRALVAGLVYEKVKSVKEAVEVADAILEEVSKEETTLPENKVYDPAADVWKF